MNNYICIKNNGNASVGQEYRCYFNPHNECFQIYKIGEHTIYEFCLEKDFNQHFIRKDIYRQEQIEKILE